jgi:serine/threonine-protein kinase
MRHKAREVLIALGHDEPPAGAGYRYLGNHDFLDHRRAHDPAPGVWDGRWRGLEDGRPPAMLFLYRVARDPLAPTNYHVHRETSGVIDALNPPPLDPGMADVTLDLRGRLLRFHKVADFLGPDAAPAPLPADWRPAFAAAGLDFAAFAGTPVSPRHLPPLASDARVAWEGPYPDPDGDWVRVEAASLGGSPVYFAVEFPWDAGEKAVAYPVVRPPMTPWTAVFLYVLPLMAVGLVLWNWRAGRTDLAGATRLAGVLFALWIVRWAVTAVHVADSREELLLEFALGSAQYEAVLVAVFYLALEPVVRKRWPWRLVGWSRLLAGRVRDPLVGRDVLVGLAAGTVLTLGFFHCLCGPVWAPELLEPLAIGEVEFDPAWCVTRPLTTGVHAGFLYFFLIFLCHWVCRDRRVGAAAAVLIFMALIASTAPAPKFVTVALTLPAVSLGFQYVALRFGLLAFLAALLPTGWLFLSGWTLDVRAWYATGPNLGVAVMLALTLYAAHTATGGRLLRAGAD